MKDKFEFITTTTYSKRKGVSRVSSFNGVISKLIVSTMALSVLIGAAPMPSAAGTSAPAGNLATVSEVYSGSLDSAVSDLKGTLDTIKQLQRDGTVTDKNLQTLANQLYKLETAAKGNVTSAVSDVVLEVESVLGRVRGVNTLNAVVAVSTVKRSLGIVGTVDIERIPTVDPQKAAPNKVKSFTDVDKGFWGYNDIFTIVNKGAIEGTAPVVNGVGTFSPVSEVSLGQFLAIATRLVAPDEIVASTSSNQEHWALKNYNAAVQIGLINPREFSSDDASLNKSLTREDMAYLLVGLAQVNGEQLQKLEHIENNIGDLGVVAANRKEAVLLAYSNGLLQGTGSTFAPKQTTKRAEIAAVFCRVMNYTNRPNVVVKDTAGSIENEPLMNEKGQMSYHHSKKYVMDAMATTRVYKEGGKYFVSCDLAVLPDGFKWVSGADVFDSEAYGYDFSTSDCDWIGKTGHIVMELKGIKTLTDTAPVHFVLRIKSKATNASTFAASINSGVKNKADMGSETDSAWVAYDTSAIFAGVK
ncbi:MAG: S-layer homology domain-containing protein [Anaerovoracaceae bacterium]